MATTTFPKPITDHDEYIAWTMALGRPAILKLIRTMRIRAGHIKDTRELAECLWRIVQANQRFLAKDR